MTQRGDDGFATLVIVAAGRGERFGHSAKVLEPAGGRPLLEWSLHTAMNVAAVCDVIIVSGEHTESGIHRLLGSRQWGKPVAVIPGGARRQDSVAAGVAAVSPDREVVLIHDGARPLASVDLFERCARAAREHGAAIVATPVSDTLKRAYNLMIRETVSRDELWSAQTPQGFQRGVICSAIERTRSMSMAFTDEASLLEALGEPVHIVPGERINIKVTHREDLEIVDAILARRARQSGE
jgi:2-C-methyl-D-erythritol 4-phosphate cytidylyltransferase